MARDAVCVSFFVLFFLCLCVLRCLDPSSIYDFFLAQGHVCWGKHDAEGSLEKHSLVKVPTSLDMAMT